MVNRVFPKGACPNREELIATFESGEEVDVETERHVNQCRVCEATLSSVFLEDGLLARFRNLGRGTDVFDETEFAAIHARLLDDSSGVGSAQLPFDRVGDYMLLAEIDSGGMGVVYRAHQPTLNRNVALKMIRQGGTSANDLRRFEIEGKAIARLQHPHIIQLFEFGEHEGYPFFSMELMEGGSLQERLDRASLPVEECVRLVQMFAEAIHYSHSKGVLHRDLKPSNVLFTQNGTAKVSDFGLAKFFDDESQHKPQVTAPDSVIGTPSYMAPEQARGAMDEICPATDVYGLGALLYHMLVGLPPFRGRNKLETLELVRNVPPPAPSSLREGICPDLESICQKCLEKVPGNRYESAEALAEDLKRWRKGELPHARRERRRRTQRRLITAGAILLLMLCVMDGVRRYNRWRRDPTVRAARIEASLSSGMPVTLVGEREVPRYFRIAGQVEETSPPQVVSQEACSIQSRGVAFLVLVEDPQKTHFRVRGELHHDAAGSVDSGIGLAVGLSEHQLGDVWLHVCSLLRFDDVNDARLRALEIGRTTDGNRLRLIPYFLMLKQNSAEPIEVKLPGFDQKFIAKQQWREIEVEVAPNQILARFGNRQEQLVLDLPTVQSQVARQLDALCRSHDLDLVDPGINVRSRGSVALYIRNGSLSFRNVVIEPLSP